MKHTQLVTSVILVLSHAVSSSEAGTWSFTALTGDDAETGIDTSKKYTHLVDFGADAEAATINGVKFTAKSPSGPNYTLVMGGGSFVNNGQGPFVDTGLGDLFTDFYYGGVNEAGKGGIQKLTLTGLREAHTYRLSFFVSGWGNAPQDITVSDASNAPVPRIARDGTRWIPDPANPEYEPTGAGSPGAMMSYEYTASADGTLVMTMDSLQDGDTFHFYGFINELIGLPGDADSDGMPDIYEQANGLNMNVNDAALDSDNDGLKNLAEYNLGTKANNPDTDGDGLKDGVETNTGTFVSATDTGTSPLTADTDGDGLIDGVEGNSGTYVSAGNPGSHPLKPDTDGDGFTDGFEAQRGFNPNASTSTPESDLSIRTAIEFRFNAAAGVSYRIEGSADLQQWTTVEGAINGAGAVVTRFYSTENTPMRYYRWARN
jgi:hypothetical protein